MISKVVKQEKLVEESQKLFAGKEQMSWKRTKNKLRKVRSTSPVIFERPTKLTKLSLGLCQVLRERQGMFFSFRDSPWNLVKGSVHPANTETPNKFPMTCSKVHPRTIKSQSNKKLQQRCKRQAYPFIVLTGLYSKFSRGQWPSISKAKTQSKIFVIIFR